MDNNANFNPNEPVLWIERVFQQEAYNIGFNALPKSKNPYPYNSSNWYSWNKGRNTKDWDKIKH